MEQELSPHTPVVAVENVSKSYGAHVALKPLTFEIARGEVFALLGPNGAGKTTLLRILTGVFPPDTGQVRILGQPGMYSVRRKVGYLPEERGLYKKQKVGDILQYLGELKGLSAFDARTGTRHALAQVGMESHENSLTESLSKGMAQRVQIASALVHDPPFLILDEPFSGLDPVSARQMQDLVLDEKSRGRTVLLSTHQMEPVERLCDRLLMLHRGENVLYGTVSDARARFSQGILQIEHETERLSIELPAGYTVQDASVPHVTRLIAPEGVDAATVLRELVDLGVPVRGFERVTPSLEEIFVKIVGEKG